MKLEKNVIRAILLFLLGGLGSYIINNSDYKLEGYKFRTGYIFLIDAFTGGLFSKIVAIFFNLANIDPASGKDLGLALIKVD